MGIGRKQIGQSSLAGGSLNSASSRSSAARNICILFVRWPVILLAVSIAIPDKHTRLARLETSAPRNATPQSAQPADQQHSPLSATLGVPPSLARCSRAEHHGGLPLTQVDTIQYFMALSDNHHTMTANNLLGRCCGSFMKKIACLLIILYSGFLLLTRKYVNSYYFHNLNIALSAATADNYTPLLVPRILLFITTHINKGHMKALQQCWPYIVQNSNLVAMSDIFIFSTNTNQNERKIMLSTIDKLFLPANDMYTQTYNKQYRNVTFLAHENLGYQEGANLALKEAAIHPDWFTGYDWIVRINPDVLIYNDTWILDVMIHDSNAESILVDCLGGMVQTDFMAFRPESFPQEHYANMRRHPTYGAKMA